MDFERKTPLELFKEKLRTGLLTTEQAQLLANMGHPVATELFPNIALIGRPSDVCRKEFIPRLPEDVLNKLMIAIAKKVLPFFEEVHPRDKRASRLLNYTELSVNKEDDINFLYLYQAYVEARDAFNSEYSDNSSSTRYLEGYDRETLRISRHALACVINVALSCDGELRRLSSVRFNNPLKDEFIGEAVRHACTCTPEVSGKWVRSTLLELYLPTL